MAKRDVVLRYFLIINRVRTSPVSFIELSDFLSRESDIKGYKFDFSERTFLREKAEIASIFNIEIVYDRSIKKYKINEENFTDASYRMLASFDMLYCLNMQDAANKYLIFDKRSKEGSTFYLQKILHAIESKKCIKIVYQKFYETDVVERELAPYALKEFKHRWYVIALDNNDNKVKTFGLDRIERCTTLRTSFAIPTNFSIENMFKDTYGIITPNNDVVQNIVISFSPQQGKYIASQPLHHSQSVIINNEKEYRISLTLYITEDFLMELLSYSGNFKVLSPQSLVNELKEIHKTSYDQYP